MFKHFNIFIYRCGFCLDVFRFEIEQPFYGDTFLLDCVGIRLKMIIMKLINCFSHKDLLKIHEAVSLNI